MKVWLNFRKNGFLGLKKRETGTKDWKKECPRIYELGANGKNWGHEFTKE